MGKSHSKRDDSDAFSGGGSRTNSGPGCTSSGGDSFCRSLPNAERCANLDNGHFTCLCKPYYDSAGVDTRTICVKSKYHPDNAPKAFLDVGAPRSIGESLGGGKSTRQNSTPPGKSSSMGGVGNEWLWGLGGFGAAIFLIFALFCIRWIVKLRKRGSKSEKEALINGEASYMAAGKGATTTTTTTTAAPGPVRTEGGVAGV